MATISRLSPIIKGLIYAAFFLVSILGAVGGLAVALALGHVGTIVGKSCAYIPVQPYVICWFKYSNEDRWLLVGLAFGIIAALSTSLFVVKKLLVDSL